MGYSTVRKRGGRSQKPMALFVAAVIGIAATSGEADPYNEPVVMITASHSGSGKDGGGIILDVDAGRIYVATVRHILFSDDADGKSTVADSILVEFYSFPGEPKAGQVIFNSMKYDLAVVLITLDDKSMYDELDRMEFHGFASPDALAVKDELYKLGFPDGRKWHYMNAADVVSSTNGLHDVVTAAGALIVVHSQTTQAGHSGGVLLDNNDRFVGMVHAAYDDDTVATPMGSMVEVLQAVGFTSRWEFDSDPVSLGRDGDDPEPSGASPSVRNLRVMHQESVTTVTTGDRSETHNSTVFRIFYSEDLPNIRDVTIEIISGPWPTYPRPEWCNSCFFTRVSVCGDETTTGGVFRIDCDYIGAGGVIGFAVQTDQDLPFAGGAVVISNPDGTLRYEFD